MQLITASLHHWEDATAARFGVWQEAQLVGIAGLETINLLRKRAMIGYWIAQQVEGCGVVTGCTRVLCAWARDALHLTTVEIRAATGNVRSRAVAERIGFRAVGLLPACEWLYDHHVDHVLYELEL